MQNLDNTTIANCYQLECQIGTGGLATVYRAEVLQGDNAGTLVAVKIMYLPPEDHRNLSFAHREAYEYSRLDHPGIPTFRDFGKFDHGWYFLAMDYVQGESLTAFVRRRGTIPEANVCIIAAEVLDALAYLQKQDLVQRDVKPDNVLLNLQGDAILVDFGMVKRRQDTSITFRTEEIKGTPGFLSPEQLRADPELDVRSDVFSLGCTLFYSVTGVLPFDRGNPIESIGAVLNDELPSFAANGAVVSDDFAELVHRMVAKDYRDRPWPSDLKEDFLHLSTYD